MNRELTIEKGLIINDDKSLYIRLENLYKYLFEAYLINKINLKEYDDEIVNSGLYFGVPHPNKDELISGLNEYLGLNYIYLVNNFYIEKLSKEDIDILIKYANTNNITLNNELLNVIERTYNDVIKNNYLKGEYSDNKYQVCYGKYAIPSNFADNDALVFKIYYSKNTKQLNDNEFIENIKKQKEFMNSLKDKIEQEVREKMNISCNVLFDKIAN